MKKNLIRPIVIQVMILIIAYFVMTPDTLKDNTYIFGLLGSYDLVRGNSLWVLLGVMIASTVNIWFWWSRTQGVNTPSETSITVEGTTSAETIKEIKAEEAKATDPVVPKMD